MSQSGGAQSGAAATTVPNSNRQFDFLVVGGGIVGIATAREILTRNPEASVALLEKEKALALHQTGHNSGVIHAGIYYKPKSLKAELCRRGAERVKGFCADKGIDFRTPGKLVVAIDEAELARMEDLHRNALENGIEVEIIDDVQLRRLEPAVAGCGAIRVPGSGIVDYRLICEAMAAEFTTAGGTIALQDEIWSIRELPGEVTVVSSSGQWSAGRLIVCAGLQSDRLARLARMTIRHRIMPFRGEYYDVAPDKSGIVSHMIYPVPDPALPFLGIHLTPMIDGGLTVGPNAVLGLAREGYSAARINIRDMADSLAFPGFWRVVWRHRRSALEEVSVSFSKRLYLEKCRQYCPSLELDDLRPREAGIRAQAVMDDGTLVHDFLFLETERMLHVCNAPSPAATSAMPIAELIADRLGA